MEKDTKKKLFTSVHTIENYAQWDGAVRKLEAFQPIVNLANKGCSNYLHNTKSPEHRTCWLQLARVHDKIMGRPAVALQFVFCFEDDAEWEDHAKGRAKDILFDYLIWHLELQAQEG